MSLEGDTGLQRLLASTLHQATRYKELVQLFHNDGHVISYHSLLQADTAMAEKTLQAMDPKTGAVTPPNFVPGRFTHFTCDNIDINDASLDGKKNSFHATQVASWQHGPEGYMMMKDLKPSQKVFQSLMRWKKSFQLELLTAKYQ